MVRMEQVIINDKKYSLETLKLLTGQPDMEIEQIPHNVLVIAEAVDGPDKLPVSIGDHQITGNR